MKKSTTLLLFCFCFAFFVVANVFAETPEGQAGQLNKAKIEINNKLRELKNKVASPIQNNDLAREVNTFLENHPLPIDDYSLLGNAIAELKRASDSYSLSNPCPNLCPAIDRLVAANSSYQLLVNPPRPSPSLEREVEHTLTDEGSLPNEDGKPSNNGNQIVPSWASFAVPSFISLLALGLGGMALGKVGGLRREVEQNQNRLNQSVDAMKREQSNAAARINTTSSGDSGLSMRVAELQDEMQRMRDEMRSAQRAASVGATAASTVAASPSGNGSAPPEDIFPIAADAYLQKMQRTSTPLRPDVMNGVLVPATDGGAEFILVNDTTIAADAFFIIPSVPYFQSKQDFFNFYERYYDCRNPSSGTVWIRNPAVVEKVGNGWALREKGELEVR